MPTASSTAPSRRAASRARPSSPSSIWPRSKQGRTPDSVRNDAPIRIGNWTPENYDGKYLGKVTLADGAGQIAQLRRRAAGHGGRAERRWSRRRTAWASNPSSQANASIALGTSEVTPLELTAAYVPFANGGYRPDVHFIQRVTDGRRQGALREHGGSATARRQARDRRHDERDDDRHASRPAPAGRPAFAWPAAGKTGTSQNSRDAWFVGYTANLTTGVWFGNDDGSADEEGHRRRAAGAGLARVHGRRARGRAGRPLPGTWNRAVRRRSCRRAVRLRRSRPCRGTPPAGRRRSAALAGRRGLPKRSRPAASTRRR